MSESAASSAPPGTATGEPLYISIARGLRSDRQETSLIAKLLAIWQRGNENCRIASNGAMWQ
jgi:hypothetical protein